MAASHTSAHPSDRYPAAVRIALVHDWLTGVRGGERVLDVIVRAWPAAEIHTLLHRRGSTTPAIEARRVHTSPLDRIPGIEHGYRALLPLFPWAIRRLDVGDVDLVLSTSHAVAKAVRVPKGAVHLCYCFTPMRYVWDQIDTYLGRGVKRRIAAPFVGALRRFDVATSGPDQVQRFLAISSTVAGRIEQAYGRESRVLAPPVDLDTFAPNADVQPGESYLLVSGFVPYKADAVALEAFARSGRPLVVAGDGPLRRRFERDAPPHIRFVGRVSDTELARLYAGCRALVHPQLEDFGLIAVEAQACGRPVIAFGRGGVLDSVRPLGASGSPTGVFFDHQTPSALADAIDRFEGDVAAFDPRAIRRHAESFGPDRFVENLEAEMEDLVRKHARRTPPLLEQRS